MVLNVDCIAIHSLRDANLVTLLNLSKFNMFKSVGPVVNLPKRW